MRRALSLLIIALPAIPAQLESQAVLRPITGHVFAAADSTPVEAVVVGAVGTRSETVTDRAGRFALRVPRGAARITIRGIGITPDTISVPAGIDTVQIFVRPLARAAGPTQAHESRPGGRQRLSHCARE